jgi:hypothetical protein
MGSLFQAAAVFYFRQALLQLNAIHNHSPSLSQFKLSRGSFAPATAFSFLMLA